MKKFLEIMVIGFCCIALIFDNAFADRKDNLIHFFVGANIGPVTNTYSKLSGETTGFISKYSTANYEAVIKDEYGWQLGLDLGLRFFNESHIYHPGFRFFYEGNSVSGKANLFVNNNQYDLNIDTDCSLQGFGFDNYVRVIKDDDNGSGFLIVGIDYGKIETEYWIDSDDFYVFSNDRKQNNFVRFNIGFLGELSGGFGFNVTTSYMQPQGAIIKENFLLKMGLRYTY